MGKANDVENFLTIPNVSSRLYLDLIKLELSRAQSICMYLRAAGAASIYIYVFVDDLYLPYLGVCARAESTWPAVA